MKSTRIIIAIFVIMAGVIGSYLIISADNSDSTPKEQSAEDKISEEKPLGNLFAGLLNGGDSGGGQNLESKNDSNDNNQDREKTGVGISDIIPAGKDFQSVNLTGLVVENIKKEMELTADENGEVSAEDGRKIQEAAEAMVYEIVGNPDVSVFNFNLLVGDDEIKISSDNSSNAQVFYFLKMREIAENYIGDPRDALTAVKSAFEYGDGSRLKQFADSYRRAMAEMMELSVPSFWLEFHKKSIVFIRNTAIIYEALADFENDPLKAYLANEVWDILISQSAEVQVLLMNNIKRLDSEL